jgi:hypothetical protein
LDCRKHVRDAAYPILANESVNRPAMLAPAQARCGLALPAGERRGNGRLGCQRDQLRKWRVRATALTRELRDQSPDRHGGMAIERS